MSSLKYISVEVVDIAQPANAQMWAPCRAHTFIYMYMYTQCVYSLTCGNLSTHLYVLKGQTWTRKYIIGLTSAIILRRMEYTVRFLWCSVILTLVLCSASLCEEVGSGNEKYDTSSLQSSSWSKFNDATAEPPSCPDTWFVPSGNSCKCGESYDDTVSCNEDTKEVGVLDCYCMTFDSTLNATVLGACFLNCENVTKSYNDFIYHNVPRDIASANNSVCGYLYRTGTLCGQYIDGYYPAVYSYIFDCVQCSDKHLNSNWGLYMAVAYLPLTMFIICLFLFRVSVASLKLNAIILFTQAFASPLNARIVLMATKHNPPVNIMAKVVFTVFGIWIFDFFRPFLPGICLNINKLEVLALDYLIAVYPMLLMVIAYSLVELHGHGVRPVLYMWSPFHYFFARFRREWDVHTSIIDAFVTFFLLSTTKFFNVSFHLLMPTVFTAYSDSLGLYLYENASIKYFGPKHLPYGLLALAIMTVFIILPTCLLILYPLACCRKCLKWSKLRGRALDEFVYAFHQYYKDGSEGSIFGSGKYNSSITICVPSKHIFLIEVLDFSSQVEEYLAIGNDDAAICSCY